MTRKGQQYVWSDQEWYNLISGVVKKARANGVKTTTADVTAKLVPVVKNNVNFDELFRPKKLRWKKL